MSDMDKLIRRCTKNGHIDKQMLHARGVLSDNNMFGPDDVNPDPLGGSRLIEAKGFSAEGELLGRHYWIAVLWGGELGNQVQIRGWDAEWVIEELWLREGEDFLFAHPGHSYVLKLGDALSILTALKDLGGPEFQWNGDKPPKYPRFDRREQMEH